jgi:hypothetical protein
MPVMKKDIYIDASSFLALFCVLFGASVTIQKGFYDDAFGLVLVSLVLGFHLFVPLFVILAAAIFLWGFVRKICRS